MNASERQVAKCDQCLSHLESGSMWQRFLAHRHVRECSQCSQAYEALAVLKQELAVCEPLTARERQLWAQAAPAVDMQPTIAWPVWQLSLARAAVVVIGLVSLIYFMWGRDVSVVPQVNIEVVQVAPLPELQQMQSNLQSLEAEIAQLSTKAELNDVHQQVLATIDTYTRW